MKKKNKTKKEMKYTQKKKYILELTEAQTLWLYDLLTKGLDGYFERNLRERKHCDNIADKVWEELEAEI